MVEDRQRGRRTASLEVSRKVVVAEGGGGVMNGGRRRDGKGAGRRTLSLSQVYDRLENAKLVARTLPRERRRAGEKREKEGPREKRTDKGTERKKLKDGGERGGEEKI